MQSLDSVSLRFSDYKCFSGDGHGYDKILPINLIIGRNNTGKSSLIDLIDYVIQPKDLGNLGFKGKAPRVMASNNLTEETLRKVFQQGKSGGDIRGDHWDFAKAWVGHPIVYEVKPNNKIQFVEIDPPMKVPATFLNKLVNANVYPFSGYAFKRLQSDRDMIPEIDDHPPVIKSNGQGATNLIQNFLNKEGLPRALVEEILLNALNSIFETEGRFTRIDVQQLSNNAWEVYLEESEKGWVPLSNSGSGLKTILLVLALLYLTPSIEKNLYPIIFLVLRNLKTTCTLHSSDAFSCIYESLLSSMAAKFFYLLIRV